MYKGPVQGLYGDRERASLVWVEECGAEEMEGTEGSPLRWWTEMMNDLVIRHAPLLPEVLPCVCLERAPDLAKLMEEANRSPEADLERIAAGLQDGTLQALLPEPLEVLG